VPQNLLIFRQARMPQKGVISILRTDWNWTVNCNARDNQRGGRRGGTVRRGTVWRMARGIRQGIGRCAARFGRQRQCARPKPGLLVSRARAPLAGGTFDPGFGWRACTGSANPCSEIRWSRGSLHGDCGQREPGRCQSSLGKHPKRHDRGASADVRTHRHRICRWLREARRPETCGGTVRQPHPRAILARPCRCLQ